MLFAQVFSRGYLEAGTWRVEWAGLLASHLVGHENSWDAILSLPGAPSTFSGLTCVGRSCLMSSTLGKDHRQPTGPSNKTLAGSEARGAERPCFCH